MPIVFFIEVNVIKIEANCMKKAKILSVTSRRDVDNSKEGAFYDFFPKKIGEVEVA